MPDKETRLFKFVSRPGEENDVRKALDALPERVGEGDDAVDAAVFIRGSAVFLLLRGSGDLMDRLRGDAKGKKALDALRDHGSLDPEDVAHAAIARRWPAAAREREVRA